MQVKNIMTAPVVTVSEETPLSEVAEIMLEKGIGCVPVLDAEGKMSGLVTKTDFIAKEGSVPFSTYHAPKLFGRWLREGAEAIYQEARSIPVREVMTLSPVTLREDDLVKTFLEKIMEDRISHAPILRDGELVGIVAKHDLLKIVTGAA